jgi:hypothetical protein
MNMVNSELTNNKFVSGPIVKMNGKGMVSVFSYFSWKMAIV